MPIPRPTRFAYKDEYEKFKLYLTIILIVISFSCRFLLNSRCAHWAGLGRGQGQGSALGLAGTGSGTRLRHYFFVPHSPG